MAVISLFLFNLLCGLVPCHLLMRPPEISLTLSEIEERLSGPGRRIGTKNGFVEGFRMLSSGGKDIDAFEGIPYAEAPIGNRLFTSPQPVKNWDGILEAKKPSECLQLSPTKIFRVVGDLNCLSLNIYTPAHATPKSKFPVLVYIHGGSFYFGSGGEVGPAYLLNHDVILVTVNYRLGILGFISTGDEEIPGNNGLKDQALALHWVRENIGEFGGDVEEIILMGQSSGAACAHLHLLSNSSRWFAKGISLSGSAFTSWALRTEGEMRRLVHKTAAILRCPPSPSRELVECLRLRGPVALVSSQFQLLEYLPFPVTIFGPVVEPSGEGRFLTKTPSQIYLEPKDRYFHKPWMFGMTSEEGFLGLLLLRSVGRENSLRKNWQTAAPIFLDYKYSAGEETPHITKILSDFYFGNLSAAPHVSDQKLTQLFGDRMFLPGIAQGIKSHSLFAPTFSYIFDYKGTHNAANYIGVSASDWGVGHTEDLFYIFNSSLYYPGFALKTPESKMSNFIVETLLKFIKMKNRVVEVEFEERKVLWSPVEALKGTESTNTIKVLHISQHTQTRVHPFGKRILFWENMSKKDKKSLNVHL